MALYGPNWLLYLDRVLDLAFQPDRSGADPLYRQLADHLRALVASTRLREGERLPATRELAATLQLSRNTVNQAYQSLVDGGVLRSRVGQGTFVAAGGKARNPAKNFLSEPDTGGPLRAFAWQGLLSKRTRDFRLPDALRARAEQEPARFDFIGGQVDRAALPSDELRRVYNRALAQRLASIANDRDPFGLPELRNEVARSLVSRGIECAPEDIAITSGAQQALDFVARVLLDPGDTVVMEQPGYQGATLCFQSAGAHVIGVGVDGEGLRTDELARILRSRRAKLVYTTPAVQFPTGAVLSDARRTALLDLADDHQVPILEDDYDSEFRYPQAGAVAQPALKTRDLAGQVIYVGTFSKALFPGLRIGYVVAARPLLRRIALTRSIAGFGGDTLSQAAVAELLSTGALERHVRRVRSLYAARRQAMLRALGDSMPEGVRWTEPRGGHAVWVTLPREVDGVALQQAARAESISYTRGDAMYLETADNAGLRQLALAFVNNDPETIALGVARLAECVKARLRFASERSSV